MTMRGAIRRTFRHFGWEVQRVENANVEHQVLKNVLRLTGADVVLDVGANIGQFGDLLLSTGFKGTLISFEAIPAVHRQLSVHATTHSREASWVVAPCAALGSASGQVEMNISANLVSSSLLPMRGAHLEAAPQSKYVETLTVKLERLDKLAAGLMPAAAKILIKIDTQGYELEVLHGATNLLPRAVAIQLEMSLVPLYEGAPAFVDVISFMQSLGFELFGLVPGFKDQNNGRLLQADGFFVRDQGIDPGATGS
jgi:FkbM family methyltransferase